MSLPTHAQSSQGPFRYDADPVPASRIAQQSLAEDARIDPQDAAVDESYEGEALSRSTSRRLSLGYASFGSYHRPSYIASGQTRATALPLTQHQGYLTEQERDDVRRDERSLLRDNLVIPPKHPRRESASSSVSKKASGLISSLRRKSSRFDLESTPAEESAVDDTHGATSATETTPLVGDAAKPYGGEDTPENIDQKWDEAVMAGKIRTTWKREVKVLTRYSRSLIVTFLLQYSLVVVSVFTVGHLGTVELGAISLGSMTANITGYAVFQGLATAADTLCAQAYGSGHKQLVGLQLQRMILFLWLCIIPIAVVWLAGTQILEAIVPEKETARLAGLYLKITLIGTPGNAAFEAGKRYVQAQGLFTANLYVLCFVAPLNVFLHWLLVWHLKLGFIGAPISVSIVETLLPFCLLAYVYFIAGRECWGGFSRAAFSNWMPMIRLAIPGLIMVFAECLAFEVLTLSASWLGSTPLAAQSVLQTICILTFQIPFPMSVAASTRVANLIGATLADAAKTSAKAALGMAGVVGVLNIVLLSSLRFYIPRAFTGDEEVIELVGAVLPLCAAFQVFDALAANVNGLLRGIGRQEIGGWVNIICYYGVAMPISFGTCFGLGWDLYGLWLGPAVALALVAGIEGVFLYRTSWEKSVEAAQARNRAG